VDLLYQNIHRATSEGYPSHFRETAQRLGDALKILQDYSIVQPATDEDVIRTLGDH
jgi:hypothetical protein